MTDLIVWASENAAAAVTAGGGTAVTLGKLAQWGWAMRKARLEKAAEARRIADEKAAEAAEAEATWRAQVVNGLQAASAAVESMQRQMAVFGSALRDHDDRTRKTAEVVARVDGFLDRLDHVEERSAEAVRVGSEAVRVAAAAERKVAGLAVVPGPDSVPTPPHGQQVQAAKTNHPRSRA